MPEKEFNANITFQVWPNKHKKSDTHPDHRGTITFSKALLKEMVELAKADEDIVVECALWERESRNTSEPYMYGKMSVDEYRVNKNREKDASPTGETAKEEDDPFASY